MTQIEARPLADLNKLSTPNPPACYRCGKTGHMSSKCHCKEWIGHNCGKRGHIAAACRGGPRNQHLRALKLHVHKGKTNLITFLLVIQVVQKIYTCLH